MRKMVKKERAAFKNVMLIPLTDIPEYFEIKPATNSEDGMSNLLVAKKYIPHLSLISVPVFGHAACSQTPNFVFIIDDDGLPIDELHKSGQIMPIKMFEKVYGPMSIPPVHLPNIEIPDPSCVDMLDVQDSNVEVLRAVYIRPDGQQDWGRVLLRVLCEQGISPNTPLVLPRHAPAPHSEDVVFSTPTVEVRGPDGVEKKKHRRRIEGGSRRSAKRTIVSGIAKKIRHALWSANAKRWTVYEWFYSHVDSSFFSEDVFGDRLRELGLSKDITMSRREWAFVRRQMPRPRRTSRAFFEQQQQRLAATRIRVRQAELVKSRLASLTVRLGHGVEIGHQVLAIPATAFAPSLGTVRDVSPCRSSFFIEFDSHQRLAPAWIPDHLVMPIAWRFVAPVRGVQSPTSPSPSSLSSPSTPLADVGVRIPPLPDSLKNMSPKHNTSLPSLVAEIRYLLAEKNNVVQSLSQMNESIESAPEQRTPQFARAYALLVRQLRDLNRHIATLSFQINNLIGREEDLTPESMVVEACSSDSRLSALFSSLSPKQGETVSLCLEVLVALRAAVKADSDPTVAEAATYHVISMLRKDEAAPPTRSSGSPITEPNSPNLPKTELVAVMKSVNQILRAMRSALEETGE